MSRMMMSVTSLTASRKRSYDVDLDDDSGQELKMFISLAQRNGTKEIFSPSFQKEVNRRKFYFP